MTREAEVVVRAEVQHRLRAPLDAISAPCGPRMRPLLLVEALLADLLAARPRGDRRSVDPSCRSEPGFYRPRAKVSSRLGRIERAVVDDVADAVVAGQGFLAVRWSRRGCGTPRRARSRRARLAARPRSTRMFSSPPWRCRGCRAPGLAHTRQARMPRAASSFITRTRTPGTGSSQDKALRSMLGSGASARSRTCWRKTGSGTAAVKAARRPSTASCCATPRRQPSQADRWASKAERSSASSAPSA